MIIGLGRPCRTRPAGFEAHQWHATHTATRYREDRGPGSEPPTLSPGWNLAGCQMGSRQSRDLSGGSPPNLRLTLRCRTPGTQHPLLLDSKEIPNQGIDSFLDTVSFDHGPTSKPNISQCIQRSRRRQSIASVAVEFEHSFDGKTLGMGKSLPAALSEAPLSVHSIHVFFLLTDACQSCFTDFLAESAGALRQLTLLFRS
mmetsp:Transcript_47034/g.102397  ORF Transcript_47034/g.102397 Transcript_47034/m.102397 type:complete len:200 (+) Transcript_47034:1677-2276(+)